MTALVITEKALMAQVLELAALFGYRVYHPWLSIRSTPGFPDLTLLRPPRCLFVELKSQRGTVTAKQQEWLDALRQCPPLEVYLWRPADLEAIASILR